MKNKFYSPNMKEVTFENPFMKCKSYYVMDITKPRYQHREWIVDICYHLEFPSGEAGVLWVYDVPINIPTTNLELFKPLGNDTVILKGRRSKLECDILYKLQTEPDAPCWTYSVTKPAEPKQMTIAEIEEKLGYPVAIVKEEK